MDPAPCGSAELAAAERRLNVQLSRGLRELYGQGDGRYDEAGQWWVVWPLERLVAENETYWGEGWLDRSFVAFGDDGAGDPFYTFADGSSDAIARWSIIEHGVFENYESWSDFTTAWLARP